jgi:hypothetical protein
LVGIFGLSPKFQLLFQKSQQEKGKASFFMRMGGLGIKEKERSRFVLVSFRKQTKKGDFFQKLRANAPDRLVCTCVDVHTVNVWGLTVGSVVGLKLGLGAASYARM